MLNKYRFLSNKKIHEIWNKGQFKSEKDIQLFREELVRRHFVTWEEINTSWDCQLI